MDPRRCEVSMGRSEVVEKYSRVVDVCLPQPTPWTLFLRVGDSLTRSSLTRVVGAGIDANASLCGNIVASDSRIGMKRWSARSVSEMAEPPPPVAEAPVPRQAAEGSCYGIDPNDVTFEESGAQQTVLVEAACPCGLGHKSKGSLTVKAKGPNRRCQSGLRVAESTVPRPAPCARSVAGRLRICSALPPKRLRRCAARPYQRRTKRTARSIRIGTARGDRRVDRSLA